MVRPAIHALLSEVAGVSALWFCLRAFGIDASIEEPLVAYSMGVLFGIVGFLPAGIGFAEAGLSVALSSFGLSGVDIALTVVYTDRAEASGEVHRRIISARKSDRREREAYKKATHAK